MKSEYEAWIEAYVASIPQRYIRGKCREATNKMVASFPELRQAAGFVHITWGREQHFWCVTPDGEIVDPTLEQFQGQLLSYEELDLNDPKTRKKVPTGRCMDCGDDVYEGRTFCNIECENATRVYLGMPKVKGDGGYPTRKTNNDTPEEDEDADEA